MKRFLAVLVASMFLASAAYAADAVKEEKKAAESKGEKAEKAKGEKAEKAKGEKAKDTKEEKK